MKVHIQSEKSFHKGLSFFRNIFIGMMLCLFMCNQDTHAMPLPSKAKINTEIQKKYESLENKKPAELERLAYRYLKSQKLDSAMVCFSIIAGSYEESMSRADKARCANAYYRCGSIYINRYKVYSIALQNMQTALDIATDINDRDIQSGILIYIGNIYVFYADLHKSDEMMAKGFEMYRRAMHIASEQQQWNNLLMAFGNIASCTPKYASKMNILQDVEYFKTIHIPDGTPLITPFRAIANGVTLKDRHQYDEAIVQFEQASEAFTDMKDEGVMLRYQFGPACHISECYLMLGEPGNALSMMHAMEKKALELQLKDLIPEIYTRLEDIYHQQGNSLMEQKYRLMCLEEKDSLMHAERLEGVKIPIFSTNWANSLIS